MGRFTVSVFILLALFQLILGIFSQWPTTITPDAAMHAEIVTLIGQQGFMRTWEPYAATSFTYPPLFHYLAFLLPLEPIDAVRVLGLLLWLLFPLVLYFLVSTYHQRAALLAAVFIALVPSFANITIYSEFPQLLGMLLFVVEWTLLRQKKYILGGLFAGLVVLSHAFVSLVAIALLGYYCLEDLFLLDLNENKNIIKTKKIKDILMASGVALLAASLWIPAYVQIVMNALFGRWENVSYNAVQPVFGFWPIWTVVDFLFGVHGLTPFLLCLAFVGLFWVKEWLLRGFFLLGVGFSVFHLPFTQLKIYDLFALPVVVLASVGVVFLFDFFTGMGQKNVLKGTGEKEWSLDNGIGQRFGFIKRKEENKRRKLVLALCGGFIILLAVIQVQHFLNARENWFNPEIAPTPELVDAAEWLGEYDLEPVRIYSYQASAWAGVLARKLPLNPDISYVEAFSDNYREQLLAQKEIMRKLEKGEEIGGLVKRWGISYLIVPSVLKTNFVLVYTNENYDVYRLE